MARTFTHLEALQDYLVQNCPACHGGQPRELEMLFPQLQVDEDHVVVILNTKDGVFIRAHLKPEYFSAALPRCKQQSVKIYRTLEELEAGEHRFVQATDVVNIAVLC